MSRRGRHEIPHASVAVRLALWRSSVGGGHGEEEEEEGKEEGHRWQDRGGDDLDGY